MKELVEVIAKALVDNPDEVVVTEKEEGKNVTIELHVAASDMGKVIFIVTHDYEFVCRTCTRVMHLDGGGIRDDFSVTEELLPTMKKIFDVR